MGCLLSVCGYKNQNMRPFVLVHNEKKKKTLEKKFFCGLREKSQAVLTRQYLGLPRVKDKWKGEVMWLWKEVETLRGSHRSSWPSEILPAKDLSEISRWPCRRREVSPSKSKLLPLDVFVKNHFGQTAFIYLFIYLSMFVMHERTGSADRRSPPPPESASCSICSAAAAGCDSGSICLSL